MDWKERLKKEHDEILEKTNRLNAVIADSKIGARKDVSEKQMILLESQLAVMDALEHILWLRLEEAE